MSVVPIIKTAPGQSPFAEVDLTGKTLVSFANPVVHDIRRRNYRGIRKTVKHTIQRVLIFDQLGVTLSDKAQLDEWKGNRIRVRPFANYGKHTILYHSFQRSSVIGKKVGFQIGEEPTFAMPENTGQQGQWSYLTDQGDLQVVVVDTPLYERGPWDAHGIMGQVRATIDAIPTHPIAGNRVFDTAAVGVPTSVEATYGESLVIRADGTREPVTAHVQGLTATDTIRTTTYTSVTGTTHSFFVYVKGTGQVTVKVFKNWPPSGPGVLLGSTQKTLDGTWQRFDVENVTKLAGDNYTFHITFDTPGQFFVGPFNLTTAVIGKNQAYIHAIAGTATQMSTARLRYVNLRWPDAQATVYVGLRQPLSTVLANIWCIHKNIASPDRMGIVYRGDLTQWSFQKNDTTQLVAFTTAKAGGSDVVIAGCYDRVDMRIFEDGVKKNTKSTGIIIESTITGIHVAADDELNQAGMQVGWVRVDSVKATDAEILAQAALYSDAEARAFTLACEGRDFEIERLDLEPTEGSPDEYQGEMVLLEVSSNDQATTEEP